MGQKKIEIEEKWHHKPTTIYQDNYGYLANYYQPMLDYMDARDRGAPRGEYPHLPWTNERGRDQYRPSNKIQKYPTAELNALAVEAERTAQRNLKHVPVGIKSSDFAKIKTVQASRLSEHIRLASVDKEIKSSLAKRSSSNSRARSESRMADYELSVPLSSLTRRPQILHNVSKIKSISSIKNQLLFEANRNLNKDNVDIKIGDYWGRQGYYADEAIKYHGTVAHKPLGFTSQNYVTDDVKYVRPIQSLQTELTGFENKATHLFDENSKQTSIEIEQLNARVVEAETKLKTEVTRIKKKLHATITDLELSLDVANKNNLELQKVVKKQSLQLTELQAHYDEIQRQLAVTLDQLAVSTRKNQSLTAELEEIRGNYDNALRSKRHAEQLYEESQVRVNELTTINVNLSATRAKLEQELQSIANDYEEVTKELRIADERFQRTQVELKHTVEHLHEEQERIVKIEAIKKSLEIEVKNLSVRLEEVEANAIVGGKRIISKLEARIRDIEIELDEEKRRHAETVKILRKKERTLKEIVIQSEEDHKNVQLLQDTLEKATQKLNLYKRQLQEQEGMSQQSVTRVRRFQRELEAAEDRADTAESNLSLIRAKHRTFVTTNTVPGSQVYLVQETRTSNTESY